MSYWKSCGTGMDHKELTNSILRRFQYQAMGSEIISRGVGGDVMILVVSRRGCPGP